VFGVCASVCACMGVCMYVCGKECDVLTDSFIRHDVKTGCIVNTACKQSYVFTVINSA